MTSIPPKSFSQRVVIPLDSIQDVDDLISDLRYAKKKAKQTAGLRRVQRMTPGKENNVTFEIHFPLQECIRA